MSTGRWDPKKVTEETAAKLSQLEKKVDELSKKRESTKNLEVLKVLCKEIHDLNEEAKIFRNRLERLKRHNCQELPSNNEMATAV